METGKENGEINAEDKDEKDEKEIPVTTEASSPMEDQNASVKGDDQGDSKIATESELKSPTETDLKSPTSPVSEEPSTPVMNGANHHNEEEDNDATNDTTNDVDGDNKSEAMSVTSPEDELKTPLTPSNPIAGMLQEMQSPGVETVKNMDPCVEVVTDLKVKIADLGNALGSSSFH